MSSQAGRKSGIEVYFEVVNSVKGGSGKSTFSFLLAANIAAIQGNQVYIIDLDLRGSSWIGNYGHLIWVDDQNTIAEKMRENPRDKGNRPLYVNELVERFSKIGSNKCWMEIRAKDGDQRHIIKICPAYPEYGYHIDDLEVDLFEHMIYKLINDALKETKENVERVHFILDMPPSHEKHAEKVLKNLLLSEHSALYNSKCFKNSKNDEISFQPYKVFLYMISAVDNAHLKQNESYVRQMIRDQTYSSAIIPMIKKNRFAIMMIGNDNTGILGRHPSYSGNAQRNIDDSISNIIHEALPRRSVRSAMKGKWIITHKDIIPHSFTSLPDEEDTIWNVLFVDKDRFSKIINELWKSCDMPQKIAEPSAGEKADNGTKYVI